MMREEWRKIKQNITTAFKWLQENLKEAQIKKKIKLKV